MDFTELGYNNFLKKEIKLPQEISSDTFDLFTQNISANKIAEGVARSLNKVMFLDFDKGNLKLKQGNLTRVEIGKFIDDKFGLRVYDKSGNIVVDSTD